MGPIVENFQEINVRVLDEVVDVWRPTQAASVGSGLFELFPTPDFDPLDENWEFLPGATVRAEQATLLDGMALISVLAVVKA